MTHATVARRLGTSLFAISAAYMILVGSAASAAIVPSVPLGTLVNYVVLGASTVTNTGDSVLNGSLGLSPGTSVTGFPPGIVNPPGAINVANGPALQAQNDLTIAYDNAAGRSLNATTTPDLGNLTLVGGVYAAPAKGALTLTGPLTLDGAGDRNSVFIFQTDSTLTTDTASTVNLINGAQACNVFWLVGSSATLGTNSSFVGTILALTSITVTTGVTVQGRALARNAAVTLDTNTFSLPVCAEAGTTPTTPPGPTTTTTVAGGSTTTSTAGGTTSPGATTSTVAGTPAGTPQGGTGTTAPRTGLPFTGVALGPTVFLALFALILGASLLIRSRSLKD